MIAFIWHGHILAAQPADVVLRGGKIVTLDEARPLAEAIATRGDRIVMVGKNGDVASLIGEKTRVVELEGRLVTPGFIEGHGHFLSLGESKVKLDLSDAKSWNEIVELVAQAAKKTPRGKWIEGLGWHQGKWTKPPEPNVEGYPITISLSKAVPDHPVLLTHGTGHMCLANAKAMELAGITRETKNPRGGEILRDQEGNPTGAFRETAAGPIHRALAKSQRERTPEESLAESREMARLAGLECLKYGVTSFQDAGSSCENVDLFKELARQGELPIRLWVMLNDDNDTLARRLAEYRTIGFAHNHVTVRGIKRMIDGALGTHGAWLLAPYDDLPTSTGLNTMPLASLRVTAELAAKHDYQLCVHAIGDLANRETLNLMEEVFKAHPEKRDWRWRIEHAQHLHLDDIPRFAKLGVIASMQGCHATSDGPFVVRRLGERRAKEGAYVWKSLLDAKALVINGTDVPVEKLSPIDCFYSTVTRRMANGETFFPEQCLSREEALRSYTLSAAYAAFEEDLKGSLIAGKLADLVVLSQNILTVPADKIRNTHVDLTIIGGRVLYERK